MEDELKDGNYHLLAKPADEHEQQFAKPEDRSLNPLLWLSVASSTSTFIVDLHSTLDLIL